MTVLQKQYSPLVLRLTTYYDVIKKIKYSPLVLRLITATVCATELLPCAESNKTGEMAAPVGNRSAMVPEPK